MGDWVEYEQLQKSLSFEEIAREITNGLGQWQRTKTICNAFIDRGNLTETNKVWFYLINLVFKPLKKVSTMRQDLTLLLYALVKGFELDMGRIIKESIQDYVENNFLSNIPHLALITLLYIKGGGGGGGGGGIKVVEDEEKSTKASPLTLIGVLKTPVEGEEVERIRKRRRTKEQPRKTILIVEAEEECDNEERGVFSKIT